MYASYIQRGETLDYTAVAAIAAGTVVPLGERIGVAGGDMAAGETGAVHVVGVFSCPKAAGEIAQGAALYYDATAQRLTLTAGGNVPAGYAVAPATADAETAAVKLLG